MVCDYVNNSVYFNFLWCDVFRQARLRDKLSIVPFNTIRDYCHRNSIFLEFQSFLDYIFFNNNNKIVYASEMTETNQNTFTH